MNIPGRIGWGQRGGGFTRDGGLKSRIEKQGRTDRKMGMRWEEIEIAD